MSKLAVIFPGQGSQSVGMLKDFYDEKIVIDVFNQASSILGYDVFNLIAAGPKETLDLTEYTQPLILTCSYALWKLYQKKCLLVPDVVAGHSLGEYSALVCASSISFEDALLLVKARAKIMQASTEGMMAVLIGLDKTKVNSLCESVSTESDFVQAANYNSEKQIVIAGSNFAVEKAMQVAKEQGAKLVKKLPVSVPSHCLLMKDAADEFTEELNKVNFKLPKVKILHNVSATSFDTVEEMKLSLTKQLYSPVRWVEIVNNLAKDVSTVYECGPGKVLTGLNKRITDKIDSAYLESYTFFKKFSEKIEERSF